MNPPHARQRKARPQRESTSPFTPGSSGCSPRLHRAPSPAAEPRFPSTRKSHSFPHRMRGDTTGTPCPPGTFSGHIQPNTRALRVLPLSPRHSVIEPHSHPYLPPAADLLDLVDLRIERLPAVHEASGDLVDVRGGKPRHLPASVFTRMHHSSYRLPFSRTSVSRSPTESLGACSSMSSTWVVPAMRVSGTRQIGCEKGLGISMPMVPGMGCQPHTSQAREPATSHVLFLI